MSDPGHLPPPGVTVLGDGGAPDLRTLLGRVRTVLAGVLALGAAASLASAVVVALAVQHAFDEEHPWAWAGVLLTVPQVRDEVSGSVLDDLEEEAGTPLDAAERAELEDALDAVLASPDLRRALADVRPVEGSVDGGRVVAVAEAELRDQAELASPGVRSVLEHYAGRIRDATTREGTVADVDDGGEGLRSARALGLGAAGVLLVPAAVCLGLAVALARRRGRTAALTAAVGLLLAAVLLAPGRFVLDHLPGPAEVPGAVLAALGALVGAAWLWTLVLLALVPLGLWWAVRSARSATNADEGAGPHWVP